MHCRDTVNFVFILAIQLGLCFCVCVCVCIDCLGLDGLYKYTCKNIGVVNLESKF